MRALTEQEEQAIADALRTIRERTAALAAERPRMAVLAAQDQAARRQRQLAEIDRQAQMIGRVLDGANR